MAQVAGTSARLFAPAPAAHRLARSGTRPGRHAGNRLAAEPEGLQQNKVEQTVFEPYREVANVLENVSTTNTLTESFARLDYGTASEAAVNEQINVEYNIAYIYSSLYSFFDRDNVGLPGIAEYFRLASIEERAHAELLLAHQNVRGGRVRLAGIIAPEVEYNNDDKGEALYAFELALSLEKLNFSKLRLLHGVAADDNDAELCDFIEGNLLQEQALAVKQAAVYVSQLRRVGKGLGVFEFDRYLQQNQGNPALVIGTVAAAVLGPQGGAVGNVGGPGAAAGAAGGAGAGG